MEFGVMELFQHPKGTSRQVIDQVIDEAAGLAIAAEVLEDSNVAHSAVRRFAENAIPASREGAEHVR